MGWDKREAKRVHFDHERRAALLATDGTWRRECILVDVSESGARLRIDGSPDVLRAREFFLLLSPNGLVFRRCELVRLEGSEAGVHFLGPGGSRPSSMTGEKK